MATVQQRLQAKLQQAGIPCKQIDCYGSQIVVTSHSQDTANKWAVLLATFARVRAVIESVDDMASNPRARLHPTVRVWRTFAAM